MNQPPPKPGIGKPVLPPMRPQQQSAQFEQLLRRTNALYGSFGDRQNREEFVDDRPDPMADLHVKPTLKLIGILLVVSGVLTYVMGVQNGILNFVAGLVGAALLFRYIWRKPPHMSARLFLALALFIEAYQEVPTLWVPPLKFVDFAFFGSVKDFMGIPGMSLPIYFFAAVAIIVRGRRANKRSGTQPPPKFATQVLFSYLAVLTALEIFGIARGGDVSKSFFQILHLVTMPVVAFAFLYGFRGLEDLGSIGAIVVAVAVARSLLCVGVYFAMAHSQSTTEGFFVTTHSDSVLFVSAFGILCAFAMEHRRRKTLLRCAGLGALILLGVAFNNRRIAIVGIGVIPPLIYFALKPSQTKRKVTRGLVVVGMLAGAYLFASTQIGSDSPVWAPAKLATSVFAQQDNSSESRDFENSNLIYTARDFPLFGQGFGWPYNERIKFSDISDLFQLYLYIPHNGVLWLWSAGGLLGFAGLWFIYPTAATIAVRAYRNAEEPVERVAGLASLACIVTCVFQAWGDQGLHSYLTVTLFALAFATSSHVEATIPEPEPEPTKNETANALG